ncbi:MAG: 6-phosphofructokinase [Bdellovibrionaceae bacterium]|nr:6-phosphofructokinase [Bdellovibrionales bacterium]MCB9086481.1 6-phosphofructokinase [Pseudobdellovibrionaceae bacterium]
MANFDSSNLKKIAVYTSGGDAPGMNAAIRSVVRTAITSGLEIEAIGQGYKGLLKGDFTPLNLRSVANIIQRGGTVIKTGRSPEFHQPDQRKIAADQLRARGIQALVCIGGDGSFTGAHTLWNEHQIPYVGIPGTIDNDISGTDVTIGFDTAVNTALEAIDRIRDTAASHDRLFIVEVMGRNSGFIAVDVGVAGGAEAVFIPESPLPVETAVDKIQAGMKAGKTSSILVAAEGQKPGRAYDLAEAIRKKSGYEAKVCILGHIQRGGAPTAADRILGSRMGVYAVELLHRGVCDVMVGIRCGQILDVEMSSCLGKTKPLPPGVMDLVDRLR